MFIREFMPTLEDFFEEAIEQADPANMVEDEYKYVWICSLEDSLFFAVYVENILQQYGVQYLPEEEPTPLFSSLQSCAKLKLRMACSAAVVSKKSALFPTHQPAVQEPGRLFREHGDQASQRATCKTSKDSRLFLIKLFVAAGCYN